MKENKFIKMVKESINNPAPINADEYPVLFDDGVDFM